jgi:hydrogenase maturation protein HypF
VHKIASRASLTGFVYNDTKGVTIEVQGQTARLDEFLARLSSADEQPPLLEITSCEICEIATVGGEEGFVIKISDAAGVPTSQVTVDTAACPDCLNEMAERSDFRYRYPFINCTNCGPRYSIVKTIPYDRGNTTMGPFEMCAKCRSQYTNVADRRFHAQPVACAQCGPAICLTDNAGNIIEADSDAAIAQTAELLNQGKIVAIKGIGGFHLAVNALNEEAVERLRERKQREHKPFAMMAVGVDEIRRYAMVDETAEKLLAGPQSPIVLLPQKPDSAIAPSVAAGVNTFGFMVCYGPLHHLLFAEKGIEVLVMTSANISDEPLICKNDEAVERLGGIADAFLTHNREIYRQVDDSVVHVIDGDPAPLRRARGYAPSPVLRDKVCGSDIFAAGGDLKNTFCFVKENQFILSEHIGDLADATVLRHYRDSVEHLRRLFEVKPAVVACDLHPGYLSTQFAQSLEAEKTITIQHHWAHVGSVLAEHNYHGRVIGLVADGTGFGTDGAIWGCECLVASLRDFERFGHLAYYSLPGADKAAKEAIRPLLGLLSRCAEQNSAIEKYRAILSAVEPDGDRLQLLNRQLETGVNTVETSSLGRLFDAVAAVAGVGRYNHFEAQLPIALEAIAAEDISDYYDFQISKAQDGTMLIDFRIMIEQLIKDVQKGVSAEIISAKFHNFVGRGLLTLAVKARETFDLRTVALSGGVFCNRYLSNRLITMLKQNDFSVLFNRQVPANDGGIALGQAAIAAESLQA